MILSRFKHHFLSSFISTVSSLIIGSSFTIVHRSFLWLPLYSFPLYFQFHDISLFHFSSIACPYDLSFDHSSSLQYFPPHIFFLSFYSIITLNSSPSSLLITCPYHLSLASSPSLQCLPPYVFLSFHSIITLNSSPSSLLITCPYHLSLAFLVIFPMFTTLRLPIFPSHNNSEHYHFSPASLTFSTMFTTLPITCPYHLNLAFLVIFPMFTTLHISSQPCFSHLLCNVYYSTFS